jgi:hypothetical protein
MLVETLRSLRSWIRKGERSSPEGMFGRFLADVRAAEAGKRLVGLGPDHDELAWAMRIAEREWANESNGPDDEEED